MTIPFKTLKDSWMKDPAFRAEYERLKPEFAHALSARKIRQIRKRRVTRKRSIGESK